ncbi:hypothetical protein DA803_00245 [[Mycoplasma] phocae]|uniref:DUF31 domain-containing protein n=1 Tax=[Mycoplasma] phocae TaxID=142651 RepID=A0A2Z5IPW8_9BACT|nr:variable surface lipoprotein [[Mycoplasma] phocae]AXE60532.1 hypothetical protein DA803_00245 [[Mycoplasma] phocae]
MKKNTKILLAFASVSILPILPLVAASCSNDRKQDDKKSEDKTGGNEKSKGKNQVPIDNKFSKEEELSAEFKEIINNSKLGETFELKFKDSLLSKRNISDIFPTEVANNSQIAYIEVGDKYKDKIRIQLYSAEFPNGKRDANVTGKFSLSLAFSDKKTGKLFQKTIAVEGFKKNPLGIDENGVFLDGPTNSFKPAASELEKYYKEYNQNTRFEKDNEKYVGRLNIENKKWNEVRSEVKADESKINEYNEKAKELNLDTFENSAHKGFTLPSYKEDGTLDGLSLFEGQERRGPSWVDALGRDEYKTDGLARLLPNENYRRSARQSFSVSFSNKGDEPNTYSTTSGTMWIMDYQLNQGIDKKYPTKWYFGTNAHVADALTNKTHRFGIIKLLDSAKILTKFRLAGLDDNFVNLTFKSKKNNDNVKDNGIKTVFSGKEFLSKNPVEYLTPTQKEKYKNAKDFIDFAVLEIDFENIELVSALTSDTSVTSKYPLTGEKLAKFITNDYADDVKQQIKFKANSYLSDENYKKIDFPLSIDAKNANDWWNGYDELFITGYPSARNDYFLKPYVDDDQRKRAKFDFSLWTNSDYRFYDGLVPNDSGVPSIPTSRTDRGNFLSYNIGYRTFNNKPGLTDSFISANRFGSKLYADNEGKEYIAMGLEYSMRHYAPIGGASGSSVRTQNNELVAVYHVSNTFAHTGLAAAFRSEGFDYKGLFGQYNLPQYDLIYGGGKDQKNSYRKSLKKLYKDQGIKTNLFKDGLDDDKIPPQFKFTQTPTNTNK